MSYSTSAHCKFHNRYHIVWITKYLYKVLNRAIRLRLRTLTRQICKNIGVRGRPLLPGPRGATVLKIKWF